MSEFKHIPVLLQQVIEMLKIKQNGRYIDGTLGGGGHTREIIKHNGVVLGIDQDYDALDFVKEQFKEEIKNNSLILKHGNFKNIEAIAKETGFEKVSGVLLDLGVSSYQLDKLERGFSIKGNEKLDMRMNQSQDLTAYEVVNTYSAEELADIFTRFGEEEKAQAVADQIILERGKKKIETTGELVSIIEKIIKKQGFVSPATKIFQAIRIEVNSELVSIKEGLEGALHILEVHGRICVISFHSLEDRIVKQQFNNWERQGIGMSITKKPITADLDEVASNSRARSAKLRVFEKYNY